MIQPVVELKYFTEYDTCTEYHKVVKHTENMIIYSRTCREYYKVLEHTENMLSYSRTYREYHKV